MAKIAAKLNRSNVSGPPTHPYRGAPAFWNEFAWTKDEQIEHFTANFEAVGGHVVRLADWQALQMFIADKAIELGAKTMIRQNQPELNALDWNKAVSDVKVDVWNTDSDESWTKLAANADIGIAVADYAVAHTGSITMLSGSEKGRSVTLLPTVLFAIIPSVRLVTRLGEVLREFDQNGRDYLPAGIHFISGPSRSADIENDLTIGVHGPGIVFALIIDLD